LSVAGEEWGFRQAGGERLNHTMLPSAMVSSGTRREDRCHVPDRHHIIHAAAAHRCV
jgi:hypothetical protein